MFELPKIEMSIFEAILARRSVRKYKSRFVDQKTVRNLLEAAIHAPSANSLQPWGFVVIQDKTLLKRLSDRAKPLFLNDISQSHSEDLQELAFVFKQQDFNVFYDAGTLILVCGQKKAPYYAADCWLAAENLALAACGMDLGTCIIGSALSLFSYQEFKTEFGIPNDFEVVVPIIVGYPDKLEATIHRKSPVVFYRTPVTN